MSGKAFVDSNILIYAYDADAGAKHRKAAAVLESLWEQRLGVLSLQVLQEFYVNVTRKIRSPLPRSTARAIVSSFAPWCVQTSPAELATAFRLEDEAGIGFWDALIVAAALKSCADRILSEDLNAGQRILGITIENPFART